MSEGNYVLFRRALLAGCGFFAIVSAQQAGAATLIEGGSLLIATTTYQDVGAVAGLVAGVSQLPGATAGTTSTAQSNGDLNTVWNNEKADAAFGVTSAINLVDVNASTGAVKASETINPSVVVTSFSSKSELSLNISQTASGLAATLMGYDVSNYVSQNGLTTGVGLLDVSNSDTTAYKDKTNPVTSFYAPGSSQTYAFNRSVIQVGASGDLSANSNVTVTQTLAYGGNNGRAAVLAPNGQYYTVGNSNNGTGTPSQLTTSTGLEVVTPGSTNSTMIDPNFKALAADKAGKSSNFRGLTLYNDNLYFTKGSGSNGIDTVYTVSNPGSALPTSATAASATITVLPGFPTDSAKLTGGNFTPFGLFFANSTTLYVADEGTGNSTDKSLHAGLEKWSLVGGTWQLDYTLQSNLIGQIYKVAGWNYTETTTGLRDLTGKVNADGTVTLWAVTSTTSSSADNGADPNEIVTIADNLFATSLPTSESFSVLDGPQAGLRYGGVAYAVPEPSTWAMMLIGFGGLGFAGHRRNRKTAVSA
jgi:hypothetical protein